MALGYLAYAVVLPFLLVPGIRGTSGFELGSRTQSERANISGQGE